MHIEKVVGVSDEIFEAVAGLVPQLSVHLPKPSRDDLTLLVNSGTSVLLVARHPYEMSPIVGMLTLSLYRVPTGGRSIVEDLVVDNGHRQLGIAKALMLSAIQIARVAGANGVSLTSNFQRMEANQFYLAMGFKKRETNIYFYALD